MHLSLFRAFDPYAQAAKAARRDKAKLAELEPFVIELVLQKSSQRRDASAREYASARREAYAPEDEEISTFEEVFSVAYAPAEIETDAVMPEDAFDAQDLCALLEAGGG